MLMNCLAMMVALVPPGAERYAGPFVDPAAKPYVQVFYREAAARGVAVTGRFEVRFSDLKGVEGSDGKKGNVIGVCYAQQNLIELDEERWETLGEEGREALIFHEFGHCELGQGHREGSHMRIEADKDVVDDVPNSIMRAIFIGGSDWGRWRDYYLDELFRHSLQR